MADRLFDRGNYAAAKAEYAVLNGAEGIAADELLHRLAECERLSGKVEEARRVYSELAAKFPLSRHTDNARLMKALIGSEAERVAELKLLDSDKVRASVRAAALYHLGMALNDRDMLKRSFTLDPKGTYAKYAKFQHALLLAADPAAEIRRKGVGDLIDIHYAGEKELSRLALFNAARCCYSDKRYGESSILFRRYLKLYPSDSKLGDVRSYAAWSDYLSGKFADAASLCADGSTDDTAYLLAMCAHAMGEIEKARSLMARYMEKFPAGRHRASVELPLARMKFDGAEKSGDVAGMVEAARRSAEISKSSRDRLRLAWAYEKSNLPNEALAEYSALAKDFPGSDDAAEALFRKAMIDIRAQRLSAAELSLSEALASGKNDARRAEALYWRGICAVRLGHNAKAVELLREALEKGLSLNNALEARLVLADEMYKAGDVAKAKAAYAALIREGAAGRMTAAKIRVVGRFLLECSDGDKAIEEAKICAKALLKVADSPEWRQAAFALQGAAEEAAGEYSAAIGSYRQAMAETIRTEEMKSVSLKLGILLYRSGDCAEAERSLKEAVKLNASDASMRAKAYLYLARTREADGDVRGACDYATVVVTLFDDPEILAEAKKILSQHSKERE